VENVILERHDDPSKSDSKNTTPVLEMVELKLQHLQNTHEEHVTMCALKMKITAKEKHQYKQKILEALEIIKHPPNLYRDGGMEISRILTPLLTQVTKSYSLD